MARLASLRGIQRVDRSDTVRRQIIAELALDIIRQFWPRQQVDFRTSAESSTCADQACIPVGPGVLHPSDSDFRRAGGVCDGLARNFRKTRVDRCGLAANTIEKRQQNTHEQAAASLARKVHYLVACVRFGGTVI